MKTLALFTTIMSCLFLYGYQKAKQEVTTLRIENTELIDTLDARSTQLEKRNKEYESLSTNYATLKEELDKAQVTQANTPADKIEQASEAVAGAPASDTTSEPVDPLVDRLRILEGIYDTAKAELDRKKAVLDTNLKNAQDTRSRLSRNTPQFREQNNRQDSFGRTTGGKGVRTSDADRARAMEKHTDELRQWDAYITTVEAAQDQLSNDYRSLEDNYRKAVSEAKKVK